MKIWGIFHMEIFVGSVKWMDAQDVWLMNNDKYANFSSIYIYLSAHNALRFMKIVLNACMILLVHSQSVQFVVLDFT